MRELWVDDGLPAPLAAELVRRGRPARSLSELDLQGAADADLLAAVAVAGAVLVTVEERLPHDRPAGATVAVVGSRGGDPARREAVHRWAHAIASQRPGSARRYAPDGHRAWRLAD